MPDTTPPDVSVAVCDWNGRLAWSNKGSPCCGTGNPIWEGAAQECQETVKVAVSHAVTVREPQEYEASNLHGEHFHVWMWPLNSPELAVCLLAMRIPKELTLLSSRERDCMRLLAAGCNASGIAAELDISASTAHTHLKRARQRLGV